MPFNLKPSKSKSGVSKIETLVLNHTCGEPFVGSVEVGMQLIFQCVNSLPPLVYYSHISEMTFKALVVLPFFSFRTGSKLGISPLMLAAMNGHTAAVKLLLDMGSDINAQIETNRNTALTLACFQGRTEVVSLLLDRKANVEHRAKVKSKQLEGAPEGGACKSWCLHWYLIFLPLCKSTSLVQFSSPVN